MKMDKPSAFFCRCMILCTRWLPILFLFRCASCLYHLLNTTQAHKIWHLFLYTLYIFIKTFILLSATPSNLPWSGCCHSDAHHSGAAPPVPSFSPAASPHMFFELSLFHYPGTHFNIISGVIYRVFQFLYFMLRYRNPPLYAQRSVHFLLLCHFHFTL